MKGTKARGLSLIAQLEADYALLNDKNKLLSEGAPLTAINSGVDGRVTFELTDLPLKELYKTERGNLVQRATSKTLILSTPDQSAKRIITIDDTNTKEGFEEEFRLFTDAVRLLREGAIVRKLDQTIEEGRVVHRLSDMPLNEPYVTEKKNIFIRISETSVQFGHKVIEISSPTALDVAIENASFEIAKIIDDWSAPKKKKATPVIVPTNTGPGIDISFIDTIRFETLLKILGGKFVKRTIVLSRQSLKITRKDKTLVKEAQGAYTVLADVEDQRQFTLVIKKKSFHFVAQSGLQREEVLGAIRTFSEQAKKMRD